MALGDWRYAIPVSALLVKMIVVLMQDKFCYTTVVGGDWEALGRRGCAGVLSSSSVVRIRVEVVMHEWI
jgi:hypothetical protein